jgi:asparagine synthase (glutamine-hydrolysing)
MCGIIGIFGIRESSGYRGRALSMASKLRHRGPDWSGIYSDEKAVIAHERLSIMDPASGAQPLIDRKTGRVLAVNGEIYNFRELKGMLRKEHDWQTGSDCEVILYLYDEYGPACVEMLSGIFAFVLYDPRTGEYFAARDHLGICPLYIGWDEEGATHLASEMKSLVGHCSRMREFPPGCHYDGGRFAKWYSPSWTRSLPCRKASPESLRLELEKAVERQLMSDVPYGVLISGGLDSSIISAIASRIHRERGLPPLHSFSIGLEGSPDLRHARHAAEFLGTKHHEITFTIQEGMDALRDVIYHLETFDVTTVRASTPMYLVARKIRSFGIKMVLSGEGSDEVFGGYLYFHMAPSAKDFHEECVRKLSMLSKYDCLRANKSTAAWGVETRVPFLDKEFLEHAMGIDPADKMCPGQKMEKHILREAFSGYLPDSILWRQKEQFSDGVGYGWIDHLKKHAQEAVSDSMMAAARDRFPLQSPMTKEEYFYRQIFEELFPGPSPVLTVPVGPSIACSTPTAIAWSKEFQKSADPSGRSVAGVHKGGA